MNSTYSRQQIRAAIDHWTSKLNVLDESKSKLIDDLIKVFGYDIVASKTLIYVLNEHDLHTIYQILNRHLFGNSLSQIVLKCWNESQIVDKLNEHAIKSNVYDQYYDSAHCYGVMSGICLDVVKNGHIDDITISDEIIMMNMTYLKTCIFIFAVACICHEMIHYADRFTTEFHDNQLKQSQTQQTFDSHKDVLFQTKMKLANDNGIHVVEKISKPFEDANNEARYVLARVLEEDADKDVVVMKTNDSVMMKNTRTGKSTFVLFD